MQIFKIQTAICRCFDKEHGKDSLVSNNGDFDFLRQQADFGLASPYYQDDRGRC